MKVCTTDNEGGFPNLSRDLWRNAFPRKPEMHFNATLFSVMPELLYIN